MTRGLRTEVFAKGIMRCPLYGLTQTASSRSSWLLRVCIPSWIAVSNFIMSGHCYVLFPVERVWGCDVCVLQTDEMPMAKFSFDPSPMQVLVKEQPRPFYHFITTVCAIIGTEDTLYQCSMFCIMVPMCLCLCARWSDCDLSGFHRWGPHLVSYYYFLMWKHGWWWLHSDLAYKPSTILRFFVSSIICAYFSTHSHEIIIILHTKYLEWNMSLNQHRCPWDLPLQGGYSQ